jgi:hypothetical protein
MNLQIIIATHMRHARIDCSQNDWKSTLKNAVEDGKEIDLFNFDYGTDGKLCERLVIVHALQFVLDPKARAGFLKKPS